MYYYYYYYYYSYYFYYYYYALVNIIISIYHFLRESVIYHFQVKKRRRYTGLSIPFTVRNYANHQLMIMQLRIKSAQRFKLQTQSRPLCSFSFSSFTQTEGIFLERTFVESWYTRNVNPINYS